MPPVAYQTAAKVPGGAFGIDAMNGLLVGDFGKVTASGKLDPHFTGRLKITKATAAALTLAAPSQQDDGQYLLIISSTAAAHTVTATGLFVDGAGHTDVATFAAQKGASILLMALDKIWYVLRIQGVTMS